MKRFLVADKSDPPTTWRFEESRELMVFMWGKKLSEYAVYIRQDGLSLNGSELMDQLEMRASTFGTQKISDEDVNYKTSRGGES